MCRDKNKKNEWIAVEGCKAWVCLQYLRWFSITITVNVFFLYEKHDSETYTMPKPNNTKHGMLPPKKWNYFQLVQKETRQPQLEIRHCQRLPFVNRNQWGGGGGTVIVIVLQWVRENALHFIIRPFKRAIQIMIHKAFFYLMLLMPRHSTAYRQAKPSRGTR